MGVRGVGGAVAGAYHDTWGSGVFPTKLRRITAAEIPPGTAAGGWHRFGFVAHRSLRSGSSSVLWGDGDGCRHLEFAPSPQLHCGEKI